jgi:hypothetical protein
MELYIEHCDVNYDVPIRGVAVIPNKPVFINSEIKEVLGEKIYFIKDNDEYKLYTLSDSDMNTIEKIRVELVEKIGAHVYHDYRHTGEGPTKPERGFYKIAYHKPMKDTLIKKTRVHFLNPIPHGVVNGTYNFDIK